MLVAAAVGTGLPQGALPLQLHLALQGQRYEACQQQAERAQILAGFLQPPAPPEAFSMSIIYMLSKHTTVPEYLNVEGPCRYLSCHGCMPQLLVCTFV